MALVLALFLLAVVGHVAGHGRLIEPPSRGSAWRYGFKTPHNYQDNELFCGGFQNQWTTHGGKCGVCGDPYQGPREHEAGGKYATGTIVRHYAAGKTMQVSVELTANHKGWFEFRLCENNDPKVKVTFECLDRHLLNIAGTKETRFKVNSNMRMINIVLDLPKHVTCSQCVLQWKYHAGNSWGTDVDTGRGCVGCGPQEEFYGCSDISVTDSNASPTPTRTTTPTPTTRTKPTSTPTTTQTPTTTNKPAKTSLKTIFSTLRSTRTTLPPKASTAGPVVEGCKYKCCSVGVWKTVKTMDKWCHDNCSRGYCPASHCSCAW